MIVGVDEVGVSEGISDGVSLGSTVGLLVLGEEVG